MERLKSIHKLTIMDMAREPAVYSGIAEGLTTLPVPEWLKIGRKYYAIPKDSKEFANSICYGQRLYFNREEPNDFGVIIRMVAGYYYSDEWNERKIIKFIPKVLNCKAKDIYPVAMRLIELFGEVLEKERNLLYREPTAIERAAGIEKLNIYTDLNAIDFLRDAFKITVDEVMLMPYNDCLVRFMNAKEIADFQERYYKLIKEQSELNSKKFKK